MSRHIKFFALVSVILLFGINTPVIATQTDNVLDELLSKVRKEQTEESRIHKEREAQFLQEKNQQARLLNQGTTETKRNI